jgi:GDPmannose 4,6-dehydratase
MIRTAELTYLITGVSGQDGFYSARRFLRKGAQVAGVSRQTLSGSPPHVQLLARNPRFRYFCLPEYTTDEVGDLIRRVKPDRIVHGAGFRDLPSNDAEVAQCYFTNCDLVEMVLNAMIKFAPRARFLFLSSAEIFGQTQDAALHEATPVSPQNHYAISKVRGMQQVAHSRTERGIFAAAAICFNHDSCLSPASHLARLVPRKLLMLKHGMVDRLKFYNTGIRRDWSHAKDFVTAFDLMLEQDTPTDFVVGSGISTTLRQYIDLTCELLDIRDRDRLLFENRHDEQCYDRIARPDRIKRELGWTPAISLSRLCRELIYAERRMILKESAGSIR